MIRPTVFIAGLLSLAGCQHAVSEDVPAVLVEGSAEIYAGLESQLLDALDKTGWRLGSADLTATSTVLVLPPPPSELETHSIVKPIRFDLVYRDDQCVAIRVDTGERIVLSNVACQPA